MRVAVLLEERCKPNSNAFAYLKKYSIHVLKGANPRGTRHPDTISDKCFLNVGLVTICRMLTYR